MGIVIGVVAAVALIVGVVVLATHKSGGSDHVGITGRTTSLTGGSASGSTPAPSTSSSATSSPTDTSSSSQVVPSTSDTSSDTFTPPPITSNAFDPNTLNEGATDQTPLTLDALVPQSFTDDKGVHYSLKAGSVQPCIQTDMSNNLQDILSSNSCDKEIAASFVDDSGQYLVSVKVLPLADRHSATVVYDDLSKLDTADFGIWCPDSGPGSSACQGDWRSATIRQWREQQHRYVILASALAVNHSTSPSITPYLDSAAKKAVDAAGPFNYTGNQ